MAAIPLSSISSYRIRLKRGGANAETYLDGIANISDLVKIWGAALVSGKGAELWVEAETAYGWAIVEDPHLGQKLDSVTRRILQPPKKLNGNNDQDFSRRVDMGNKMKEKIGEALMTGAIVAGLFAASALAIGAIVGATLLSVSAGLAIGAVSGAIIAGGAFGAITAYRLATRASNHDQPATKGHVAATVAGLCIGAAGLGYGARSVPLVKNSLPQNIAVTALEAKSNSR